MEPKPVIAVIGGTGNLGVGLARLWSLGGYHVVIGSRSKEKAEAVAAELAGTDPCVKGDDNRGAARAGGIVVLSVPFATHGAVVQEIKADVTGKIVVDTTVP